MFRYTARRAKFKMKNKKIKKVVESQFPHQLFLTHDQSKNSIHHETKKNPTTITKRTYREKQVQFKIILSIGRIYQTKKVRYKIIKNM